MKRPGLWLTITVVTTVLTLWACFAWLHVTSGGDPEGSVNVKVQLPGARDHANLVRNADGSFAYLVTPVDGPVQTLTPDEFAARLHDSQRSRSILALVLNISSPIGIVWVATGLLGQVLFTGRMIVQWLASEKKRESVVPPAFWWMSLIGSLMLLTYFLWRRDVVGILGQGIGLAIYLRNLHLIYLGGPAEVAVAAAPSTPEISVEESVVSHAAR